MIDMIPLEEYDLASEKGKIVPFPVGEPEDDKIYHQYFYEGKYYSFARLWKPDGSFSFCDVGLVSDDPKVLHEAEDIDNPDDMRMFLRKHRLESV
jgi:hypothetical protein